MAKRATKSKRSRASKREAEPSAPGTPGTPGIIRFGARAAGALALLGVFVGVGAGQGRLVERVGEVRADPLARPRFAWPATPGAQDTWMPADERERLEQIVLATVSQDPFDGASLDSARQALAQTGWFRSLERVQRLPGGVIEIHGEFRQPAAVVRRGDRDLLVGLEGELLPLEYAAGRSWPLRFIRGADAGPPRRAGGAGGAYDFGAPWPVGDVQAAIALLSRLRRTGQWERVAGIDVGAFLRTGHLTIITDRAAEIVWGAPPGARAPGERSDADKLRAFEQLFSNPGWIGAGMSRVEIYLPVILIDETAPGG